MYFFNAKILPRERNAARPLELVMGTLATVMAINDVIELSLSRKNVHRR